jgi:hypothetical protein
MRNADSMAVSTLKPKAMLKLTEPNVVEINKDLYSGRLTGISAINGGL